MEDDVQTLKEEEAIARIRRMGMGGGIGGRVIDLLAVVIIVLLGLAFIFAGRAERERSRELEEMFAEKKCRAKLVRLSLDMDIYTLKHNGAWPEPDKWCDELMEGGSVEVENFRCPAGGEDEWCHYAMNLKARAYARKRRVLLFESKAGWNQHGGPEMLSTERHGGRGCNILFNNCQVEFVPVERLEKLRW